MECTPPGTEQLAECSLHACLQVSGVLGLECCLWGCWSLAASQMLYKWASLVGWTMKTVIEGLAVPARIELNCCLAAELWKGALQSSADLGCWLRRLREIGEVSGCLFRY